MGGGRRLFIDQSKGERRGRMDRNANEYQEDVNWQEINSDECDENSLYDMCSWAEAN